MNLAYVKEMMLFTAEKMMESEPQLTALDQVIGDGDHGIGMKRGFTAVKVLLQDEKFQPNDVGDFFTQVGTKLMTSMGGASGAIFGTFFRAGGKSIVGESELSAKNLATLLKIGCDAVFQRGNAKQGDKTMMDALIPAVNKAEELENETVKEILPELAKAAMQGAEDTKQMIAVFGRAKNLGDRVLGHADPGAVSMALILTYMDEFAQQH